MAKIDQVLKGAYDAQVILEGESSPRNMSEVMKDIVEQIEGVTGDVIDVAVLADPVAGSAKNTDTFDFSVGTPPTTLVFVPSLAALGYNNVDYKLQAIMFNTFRSASPTTEVEVRLVDSSGSEVSGSKETGDVTTDTSDTVLKTTTAFDIAEDSGFAVDFRLTTAGTDVTLYNKGLLIQVIKL